MDRAGAGVGKLGPFALDSIVVGDCLDVMTQMPDGCVGLAIVDPPYNNGTSYDSYDDERDDYPEWCARWFLELRRVAKRIILLPGHGNLWMWGQIDKPWGIGCWYKPGNPASSVLGWVTWEPWLYYSTDYRALGGPDTIRATISRQKGVGIHPCPKPLLLIEAMIEKATKEQAIVFDPFMGSGTTAVAAKKMGRRYFGCDISEEYVRLANDRVAKIDGIQLEMGVSHG